jgi:hypothetical protein
MIRILSIFVAVSMLTGIKCNSAAHDKIHHAEQHGDQWTRIEANSTEIRAQLTSLFSTAHCMDSLLDSASVAKRKAPVRRTYLESPNPNPHPQDSLIFIIQ